MPTPESPDQLDFFGDAPAPDPAPARVRAMGPLDRLATEPEVLRRLQLALIGGHTVSIPDDATDRWPDVARTLRAIGRREAIERRHGARADLHLPLAAKRPDSDEPPPDPRAWMESVEEARGRLEDRTEISEAAGALLLVAERTLEVRGSTFRDRALRVARTLSAADAEARRIEADHMRAALACQTEMQDHDRLPAAARPRSGR